MTGPDGTRLPPDNPARHDLFARHLQIEVIAASTDRASVRLAVAPHFINGAGVVHGGILFTLADYAFALAANAGPDTGLAVSSQVHYVKAAAPAATLFAEARLLSRSRKLGTYRIEVTDQDGALLACVQSMAYFKQTVNRTAGVD